MRISDWSSDVCSSDLIGLMGIQEKVLDLHVRAWNEDFVALPVGGFFRYRRGGESHAWEAGLIHTLQHAVATDSYMTYRKFSEGVHKQPPNTLRDLLDFTVDCVHAVPIGEVESNTARSQRFTIPGMSDRTGVVEGQSVYDGGDPWGC